MRPVVVGEHRGAVAVPQRQVDVATVAFALVVFRHERKAFAVLVGDFLGAVFVDRVVVAGDHGLVVAKPDLLLTVVAFALDGLEAQTRPSIPSRMSRNSGSMRVDAKIA